MKIRHDLDNPFAMHTDEEEDYTDCAFLLASPVLVRLDAQCECRIGEERQYSIDVAIELSFDNVQAIYEAMAKARSGDAQFAIVLE